MAAASNSARVVLVMSANEDEATKIARTLVEERLAACVNVVGPVRSIYRWRGTVEDAREHMLIIKTRARIYAKLERRVKELHSYEVPEVIAITPAAGSRQYLQWLMECTTAERRVSTKRRRTRS